MITFEKILDTNPRLTYFPEYDATGDYSGIKTLAYDGADYKGKHTKIFAHIGFPENTQQPVPAIVLVHGGGGHPEDIWIKKWNQKGYAAIAMDTTGYFPTKPISHLYEGFADGLERQLVPPFSEDGYVVSPDNSVMNDFDLPIEEQWMYHAVSSVILAHNILRNDPRVDSSKIGICGISWGGVITSIAIGYDSRFAFAVPIYGSGYLSHGYSDLDNFFKRPGVEKWFAEKRFKDVKMPVMWLCWNDDCCFSINSNSMSYLDTMENNSSTCLSMLHQMQHSHHHGYTPEESYWFADMVLNGHPIPKINVEYRDKKIRYSYLGDVEKIRFFYITEKMSYETREKYGMTNSFMKQEWNILDLDPSDASADLPHHAAAGYVEFTLHDEIVLTSPYYEFVSA